jgi:hypothetical protein
MFCPILRLRVLLDDLLDLASLDLRPVSFDGVRQLKPWNAPPYGRASRDITNALHSVAPLFFDVII